MSHAIVDAYSAFDATKNALDKFIVREPLTKFITVLNDTAALLAQDLDLRWELDLIHLI